MKECNTNSETVIRQHTTQNSPLIYFRSENHSLACLKVPQGIDAWLNGVGRGGSNGQGEKPKRAPVIFIYSYKRETYSLCLGLGLLPVERRRRGGG